MSLSLFPNPRVINAVGGSSRNTCQGLHTEVEPKGRRKISQKKNEVLFLLTLSRWHTKPRAEVEDYVL
jgi:hypothetical protein